MLRRYRSASAQQFIYGWHCLKLSGIGSRVARHLELIFVTVLVQDVKCRHTVPSLSDLVKQDYAAHTAL